MHVADGEAGGYRGFGFERRRGFGDQLVIEGLIEPVILGLHAAAGDAGRQSGRVKDGGEIDSLGLPVNIGHGGIDFVHAAHHFIHGAEAKFGHVLAHLLGDEEEEVDDVLGLAFKARAQNRVLRGDADRDRYSGGICAS